MISILILTEKPCNTHCFQPDRDDVQIFNLTGIQCNTVTKEYIVRKGKEWEKGRKSEFSMPLRPLGA